MSHISITILSIRVCKDQRREIYFLLLTNKENVCLGLTKSSLTGRKQVLFNFLAQRKTLSSDKYAT